MFNWRRINTFRISTGVSARVVYTYKEPSQGIFHGKVRNQMTDSADPLKQQLEVARGLIRAYFEAPDCSWERRFHDDQQACRQCGDIHVCQWLFEQDPAPDLSSFPEERILDALHFAAGYLEGRMLEAGHEASQCTCATCVWVREVLEQA